MLNENTLYQTGDLANYIKNKDQIIDAFWTNFLGFLSLLNQLPPNDAQLMAYFKNDKVQLNTITDANGDFTLSVKVMVDSGIINAVLGNEITRFLALVKIGKIQQVDENLLRDLCKKILTQSGSTVPSTLIRDDIKDFIKGVKTLNSILKPLYLFCKLNKISGEFVDYTRKLASKIVEDTPSQNQQQAPNTNMQQTSANVAGALAAIPHISTAKTAPTGGVLSTKNQPPVKKVVAPINNTSNTDSFIYAMDHLSKVTNIYEAILLLHKIWSRGKVGIKGELKKFGLTTTSFSNIFEQNPTEAKDYFINSSLKADQYQPWSSKDPKFITKDMITDMTYRTLYFEVFAGTYVGGLIVRNIVVNHLDLFNPYNVWHLEIIKEFNVEDKKNYWSRAKPSITLSYAPVAAKCQLALKQNGKEFIKTLYSLSSYFNKNFNEDYSRPVNDDVYQNILKFLVNINLDQIPIDNLMDLFKNFIDFKGIDYVKGNQTFISILYSSYENNNSKHIGVLTELIDKYGLLNSKHFNPPANYVVKNLVVDKSFIEKYASLCTTEKDFFTDNRYLAYSKPVLEYDNLKTYCEKNGLEDEFWEVINKMGLYPGYSGWSQDLMVKTLRLGIGDVFSNIETAKKFKSSRFISDIVKNMFNAWGRKPIEKIESIKKTEKINPTIFKYYIDNFGKDMVSLDIHLINDYDSLKLLLATTGIIMPRDIIKYCSLRIITVMLSSKEIDDNKDLVIERFKTSNYGDNKSMGIFNNYISFLNSNDSDQYRSQIGNELKFGWDMLKPTIYNVLSALNKFNITKPEKDMESLKSIVDNLTVNDVCKISQNMIDEITKIPSDNPLLVIIREKLASLIENDKGSAINEKMLLNIINNIGFEQEKMISLKQKAFDLMKSSMPTMVRTSYNESFNDIEDNYDHYTEEQTMYYIDLKTNYISRSSGNKVIQTGIGNITGILLHIYESKDPAKRQWLDNVIDKFGPKSGIVLGAIRNNIILKPILEKIMASDSPIKPEVKLTEEEMKKALKFNNIQILDDNGKAVTGRRPKETNIAHIDRILAIDLEKSVGNMQPKAVLVEQTQTEKEIITIELAKHYHPENKHGQVAVEVLQMFNVGDLWNNPEFEIFKKEHPNTYGKPFFHGTGTLPASMILRFGFKVATTGAASSSGIAVAGRALGDGIYFAKYLDKSCGYVRDKKDYNRNRGNVGYIFEMEVIMGLPKVHHRSAGFAGSTDTQYNFVSPEWAVFNPKAQLKIIKAYKVRLVEKSYVRALERKHINTPKEVKEAIILKSFKNFLNEEVSNNTNPSYEDWVTYIFFEDRIPVSKTDILSSEEFYNKYKNNKNINVSDCQDGIRIDIKTSLDLNTLQVTVPDSDSFVMENPKGLFYQYIHLLNKAIKNKI